MSKIGGVIAVRFKCIVKSRGIRSERIAIEIVCHTMIATWLCFSTEYFKFKLVEVGIFDSFCMQLGSTSSRQIENAVLFVRTLLDHMKTL